MRRIIKELFSHDAAMSYSTIAGTGTALPLCAAVYMRPL
jgi:hypothetical protein